ncbi:nucleotidyl transferase AbiEii/AbiGii toxin family protein [Moraxella oblonga]|uniref:nucleotidyl transferase AbiEii/AbiGii toxin family protein n=1 Tax=Moraxella oblonga TaxID=200413 RepID=UPI00082ADF6C|nr:nucleotidyl transferase AbiEii/AbiGii toxin family protein [Moraxella oblonga]
MNIIEHYQNHYPNLPEQQLLKLIANEAFLRRMGECYEPFMVKGSFISRTYFENADFRIPNDLDFVYFGSVKDVNKTEQLFDDWADKITQMPMNDGVVFKRFSKYDGWNGIDYQMNQDFPTVNGRIYADVLGNEVVISLDISFNLDILSEPVQALYATLNDVIYLPYSVPLAIQMAWKIHQGIVNPRFKDFYDLTYLIPLLTRPDDIKLMLQTLKNECQRDNIGLDKVGLFFEGQKIYHRQYEVYLNGNYKTLSSQQYYEHQYKELKNYCTNLPNEFDEFWQNYINAIKNAKFNAYLGEFGI